IELLRGVLEVPTELVVKLDEALELATHRGHALLQLARTLLHREAADAERDHLKVRKQRVRRRWDDLALGAVGAQIRLSLFLAQYEVVIDRLGRDIHHGEVDRAVRGRDVAADRVHMPPDLLEEQALLRATLGLGSGVRERGPRLVGELRVDRNDSPRVPHDGIDPRPVLVRVLDLVRGRREGIVKKPFEEELAKSAAGLRRAQEILKRADVLGELTDPLALLRQRAELPREIAERSLSRAGLAVQLVLRGSERAAQIGPQIRHRTRQQLDLPLRALLRGLELRTDALAEGRAAALSGGPADDEGKRRQRHDRRQKRKQRREIHGLRLSSSETVSTSVRGKICVRERPCTTVAERWAFCVGAVERSANGSKRPDPSAVVPRISDLRLRNTWGERGLQ